MSNCDERKNDFLVYAGVGIMSDQVAELSNAIDDLRENYGIAKHIKLKFTERPSGMEQDALVGLKKKSS
jgi:hypothetical protein